MSVRTQQVASTLRRAIQATIARGVNDPRVRGLVSVTSVRLAPDLSEATVYVSVHPGEQARLALAGLIQASKRIRSEVSRSVSLRRMPRLVFELDESIKKLSAIEGALARDDDHAVDAQDGGAA